MASEIRVDKINSLSGVGTVTLSPTGVDIAGITTAATLRATTGIVTSLTSGSLTSLGAVSGTTGTFSGAVSGTTGTFSGDVTANGGDMTISGASAILHLVDTNDNPNYRVQNIGGTFQIYDATTDTARLSIASGGAATISGDLTIPDKIIHSGDTNTAIRFPSADTVSMEVAGSEGFKVDGNGTTVTTTTDASLFINTTNSSGSHIRFQTSGTTKTFAGQAQGISGTLGGANDFGLRSAGKINFATNDNSTKRLEIETGGDVKVSTGSLVIGTSGQGISFSATNDSGGTMSSELLDDYEEGSWVPDINGGSTSNWTSKDGKYQKIGNTVTCWMRVDGGSNPRSGTSTGHMTIYNIPFAMTTDSNQILGMGGANVEGASGANYNISSGGSGNPFLRIGGQNVTGVQFSYFTAVFTYTTTVDT